MKSFKILDLFFTTFFLIISFTMFISINNVNVSEVVIELNGKVHSVYDINFDRQICINSEFGSNTVVIENKKVYVKESTCKNKLEIKCGYIEKNGESLVCLPNRLVVTLKGGADSVVNTY